MCKLPANMYCYQLLLSSARLTVTAKRYTYHQRHLFLHLPGTAIKVDELRVHSRCPSLQVTRIMALLNSPRPNDGRLFQGRAAQAQDTRPDSTKVVPTLPHFSLKSRGASTRRAL